MTLQSWLMYLALVFVATSTPGPAVLFIMTNATLHGWRKAVFAALGNIAGLLCLGIIAVTGLGTILNTSEIIFNMIKYMGAAYLIYLGIKLLVQKNTDLVTINNQVILENISSNKLFFSGPGCCTEQSKGNRISDSLVSTVYKYQPSIAPSIFNAYCYPDDFFVLFFDVLCIAGAQGKSLAIQTQ